MDLLLMLILDTYHEYELNVYKITTKKIGENLKHLKRRTKEAIYENSGNTLLKVKRTNCIEAIILSLAVFLGIQHFYGRKIATIVTFISIFIFTRLTILIKDRKRYLLLGMLLKHTCKVKLLDKIDEPCKIKIYKVKGTIYVEKCFKKESTWSPSTRLKGIKYFVVDSLGKYSAIYFYIRNLPHDWNNIDGDIRRAIIDLSRPNTK